MSEKPDVTYKDISNMDIQKQEIGIDPPCGVLLYGPPGTGKAMMVKAVANATSAILTPLQLSALDPALLCPGRLDCKIKFPVPDQQQKHMVFQDATSKMNLSDELDLEDYVNHSKKITCADVASICAEAGLQAVRENCYVVLPKDFDMAYKKAVNNQEKEH
eukprot:8516376-Ditylum_brightwellii.AAC.1